MNWTEVMVSAGVGVVLSGITTILRNRNKLNKISAILLVIIPIVVGNIIYYQYINPNGLRSGDRARNDLQMFTNPTAPDADREKICDMSIDMYTQILTLSPKDAGAILRSMLAGE